MTPNKARHFGRQTAAFAAFIGASVLNRQGIKMKKPIQILMLTIVATFTNTTSAGWDDYKQKTLNATISENKEILGTTDFNYTPGLPQLVLAKYLEKQTFRKSRKRGQT